MQDLREVIENYYDNLATIDQHDDNIINAITNIIHTLDCGGIRIAEKIANDWVVHEWIKKALVIAFKIGQNKLIDIAGVKYFDKAELKLTSYDLNMFHQEQFRVLPNAVIRKGAYIAKNTIIMPSFINIGAYIDEGSKIESWVNIGSCAQIGTNVHIGNNAGIGGLLEPISSLPTIIEDDCFIGAKSEINEGVIIGKGSILSMGVLINKSTKIYDRETKTITYGKIPPYSVVIPGSLPSSDKTHATYAAIIIKKVDAYTRSKVSTSEILRDIY